MFEGLRVSGLYLGTMQASRLFAVLMVIAGVVVFFARRAKLQITEKELFDDEPSVYSYLLDDEDIPQTEEVEEDVNEDVDEALVVGEEE